MALTSALSMAASFAFVFGIFSFGAVSLGAWTYSSLHEAK